VISGYLGDGDIFDNAIAAFATAYADQTERDHATLGRRPAKVTTDVLIEREG